MSSRALPEDPLESTDRQVAKASSLRALAVQRFCCECFAASLVSRWILVRSRATLKSTRRVNLTCQPYGGSGWDETGRVVGNWKLRDEHSLRRANFPFAYHPDRSVADPRDSRLVGTSPCPCTSGRPSARRSDHTSHSAVSEASPNWAYQRVDFPSRWTVGCSK